MMHLDGFIVFQRTGQSHISVFSLGERACVLGVIQPTENPPALRSCSRASGGITREQWYQQAEQFNDLFSQAGGMGKFQSLPTIAIHNQVQTR